MNLGAGIYRTKLPTGFSAGGVNCGVRRFRPDLGMIISEKDCVTTAVFTQNACQAAPIQYCKALLPANNIRAIITNSGQANAATGDIGIINNQLMADVTASALSCASNQVLTASTGVIGAQLEIDKIVDSIELLVKGVSNVAEKFALAILTTDLVPKTVYKEITIGGKPVHITGICKGSGMIHPNMATMLGYILTDAAISMEKSTQILKHACDKSFNMISVDADPSTNDCVFMMANGCSGVAISHEQDLALFANAVEEIMVELAKSIARDGEGASKLIEVTVQGLDDETLAKKIARSVTTSSLVKTAIYGESPNWGRILAKLGNEGVTSEQLHQCDIGIQNVWVFKQGAPVLDEQLDSLKEKMKEDTVCITIDFNQGGKSATAWGCDLTEKYVKINAEYLS
ncbi:bifunctional glutamate N-acetyltransferase/amino-acid acetyltransferase ArgJ [Legionella sp. W05-934-2]|uniref:bifunctional glutamate N-acetyltransferase/amino-acid acetyltransferase ArgJ n=1 Tax=Legionella sp. W05-934-2 TaxID=1198649 RepID=UPI0034629C7D